MEDFIHNHRTNFEEDQLPAGHEERFFRKVEKQQRSRQARRYILQATSVAALLLLSVGVWEFVIYAPNSSASLRREYRLEARIHQQYTREMDSLRQEIFRYAPRVEERDWEEIAGAVELIQTQPEAFASLLPSDMNPEERRSALQTCYERNVEGLQQMASLLESLPSAE